MQQFATPAAITAIVDIPAGRIQFIATDQDSTTVQIQPADPGKGRDVKLAGHITTTYSDGILRITGPAGHRILGSTGAVELTVQLPAGSRIEAKAASAQFTTTGQLGDVTFDSAQAIINVAQAATARLTTVDGNITAGLIGGDSKIRTVKGDIAVTEASGGNLELHTQTGAITVGASTGVCAILDAGTTLGRIRNALNNNGSAPSLTIHATSTLGDITARSM